MGEENLVVGLSQTGKLGDPSRRPNSRTGPPIDVPITGGRTLQPVPSAVKPRRVQGSPVLNFALVLIDGFLVAADPGDDFVGCFRPCQSSQEFGVFSALGGIKDNRVLCYAQPWGLRSRGGGRLGGPIDRRPQFSGDYPKLTNIRPYLWVVCPGFCGDRYQKVMAIRSDIPYS